ncbi:hypothetical protein [Streptomyces sp. SHP 1-2]|uniref:hypothetical protein n=1 Tax=Streptomyces sp. SHP 1-2 TaxID=2769489 RepID=UPI002238F8F4|nr:hypothetical protein [Streptomyces sp. SHP 1-2]MCW5252217.1 hypothetical protein [Streptomyces sp. SHP 1-2]
MPYDLGSTARLTAHCTEPDGRPATAATALCTVTLPDGSTTTPAATETAPGEYQADFLTSVPGRHTVRWVFTGPAHAYTDVLDVQDAATASVLSLADARAHLNLVSTRDDDEVRFWNATATRGVEALIGPVAPRPVTEDHHFGLAMVLVLRQVPALEVVSLTPLLDNGTVYDAAALSLDGRTGAVYRKDGGIFHGPQLITYRAGRTVIGQHVTAAARIILDHLWRTQRGSRGGLAGGGDDYSTDPVPGYGYAIPNRALQLLQPDLLPPGVA